jgi:hypothetical protein
MQFHCPCQQTAHEYIQLVENDDTSRHLKDSIDSARQYSTSDCSNPMCIYHYSRLTNAILNQYKKIILSPNQELTARVGTFESLLTVDERTRRQLLDSEFEALKQIIDQLIRKTQENPSENPQTIQFLSWQYRGVEDLKSGD